MSTKDLDYFQRRAEEERARAEAATSPAAAEIHLALATQYEDLIGFYDRGSHSAERSRAVAM